MNNAYFGLIRDGKLFSQETKTHRYVPAFYKDESSAIRAAAHVGGNIVHVVPVVINVYDEVDAIHTWTRKS